MSAIHPPVRSDDAAIALARNVVRVRYEDLPRDVVETTRKHILDQLGATIGGSGAAGCKELVGQIREWGGKEESSILVYGHRVPVHHAAQANSTMGHALEYDDTYEATAQHAGAAVIPAGFAMAERKGKVGGKELITAVALGLDVSYRLPLSPRPRSGGWPTQLYTYFGVAATAGKILGLDEERMLDNFGIVFQEAAGTIQCFHERSLSKRMVPGFASRAGIFSALMAARGVTGPHSCLEGSEGLFNAYHKGNYDRDVLTADLGKRFEGAKTGFKPYPSCRGSHLAIDATLELVKEHKIVPDDVAEVVVVCGRTTRILQFEPLEAKQCPKTVVDAQFSTPWAVATAIVYGKPLIRHFTARAIEDPAVLQLAGKVRFEESQEFTRPLYEPMSVEIRTKDGRRLSRREDVRYGDPRKPLGFEAVADKFRDCASAAVSVPPGENIEEVIEQIRRLDEIEDIASIIRLLS